jgi:replication-associated recombination protein RarA
MSNKNPLLWEKWRPKNIDDLILLPRIRKRFEDGITQHYIFHGHFGTGKTSLARILIGEYTKDTAYMDVNCSEDTGIDYLREEISNFCRRIPMFETNSDEKYVLLDEFERISPQYQDALKAFIEKYNNRGVRFIMCTNHIDKVRGGMKSRIKMIDFDCQNLEEEKYMKQEIYKRIQNVILPAEKREMSKEQLVPIINRWFPDFRKIIVEVDDFLLAGDDCNEGGNVSIKDRNELYSILYGENDYNEIYHFLMNTFGPDKISDMLRLMGKPFIDWCVESNKGVDKLFECNHVIAEYVPLLDTNTDPIVLGMSAVGKFREILKG